MDYSKQLEILKNLIDEKDYRKTDQDLSVGLDLGTANILMVVTDQEKKPVAGRISPSKVVRDGIVVDYIGAIRVVKDMKESLEKDLERELKFASVAIPPGINKGSIKALENIVESSGFELNKVIDEPEAAANVLKIKEGAVVDLGGGTTGISIVRDGKVVSSMDEPTGGRHMSLTLAGYYKIDLDKAEEIKKSGGDEIFYVIKPILEKMAYIVKNSIEGYGVENIYVVGGASSFSGIEDIFEKITGIKTLRVENALYVTPYGIAIS